MPPHSDRQTKPTQLSWHPAAQIDWAPFFAAWWETYGANDVTGSELFRFAKERGLLRYWTERPVASGKIRLCLALKALCSKPADGAWAVGLGYPDRDNHVNRYHLEAAK